MHPQSPTVDEGKAISGVIVVVLGVEGVGKSHFINTVAGEELAEESDGLAHEDTTIQHFPLRNPAVQDPDDPKSTLVLVDTPGLDDYYSSTDLAWLRNLQDWITAQYALF
ncbi:hypothetical protein EST38_g1339 [Candolleomyces aberdarensis]|uniref:Septin-type G domain-containing protein n=1 Tax=Candolleomyces aberdarensis TaxID=2316362 RepID=A0A4Q2DYP7_9AGAR|nr:hypothetical protein EST38_g1339 [Candolleomyces aberdarensis]